MNRFLRILSVAAVFSLLLLAACKKDSVTNPDDTVDDDPVVVENAAGTWNGTYSDSKSAGTFSFTLTQVDSMITGSYTATSSTGVGGGGIVSGVLSGSNFTCQTSSGSTCLIVNSVTGVFGGFSKGSSFSGTYSGSNSCDGSWSNGELTLTKQ